MANIAKKRDRSAKPPPESHYDADVEVRTKGTQGCRRQQEGNGSLETNRHIRNLLGNTTERGQRRDTVTLCAPAVAQSKQCSNVVWHVGKSLRTLLDNPSAIDERRAVVGPIVI